MKKIIILLSTLYSISAHALEQVPVIIGGEKDLDACPSVAIIEKIKPDTVNDKLAVRSGPGKEYNVVDMLLTNKIVWLCESKGKWEGIVYPVKDSDSCGVSSGISTPQPYKGKCKSGWVHRSALSVIAG